MIPKDEKKLYHTPIGKFRMIFHRTVISLEKERRERAAPLPREYQETKN
ncbi:hypothetical protein HMPREF1992_00425 [Selenomonas sp. oral taxon 892 str. F0426]|nr:hypothetical protein HMPREF1992_00425 [Selenomonas sp. oral taxon 892 str. F0426]